ncbi:cytochrome c [Limibaculum sp. FT325]|uniref:c-type cytochrome n=1 Tax=Thermohalobaculum sediminis TaxID=2939436 RepID=UPI0020C1192D|nr:c-type cytochrome [Limibaculum sediminis]MCL5778188.1 cytochrome c [Limibaculum sediminis]
MGILAILPQAGRAGDADMVARGAYLVAIMDCTGCHTQHSPDFEPIEGMHLAGSGMGFDMGPMGIVWPPNLTPDATGLAAWSDAEIVAAVRTGVRPDGRVLVPIMPWRSYAALSDEDAAALVAYLRSLPPVSNTVPGPIGPGEAATAPYLTPRFPG